MELFGYNIEKTETNIFGKLINLNPQVRKIGHPKTIRVMAHQGLP
jgi:hypothetical protein